MDVKVYHAYQSDSELHLPLGRFAPRLVQTVDRFEEYLQMHAPNSKGAVLEHLRRLTQREIEGAQQMRRDADIAFLSGLSQLGSEYADLVRCHASLLIHLVGVDASAWQSENEVVLSQVRFIRARYLPNTLKALALVEVLDRDVAISHMKRFLDESVGRLPVRDGGPTTLRELRTRQIDFNLQEAGMDWTVAVMDEGQYINKVTRCRIRDVLLEHGEPELMDVVACYPDFAMFAHSNLDLVLTRTQTLMSGGAFCDSCYHDRRTVKPFSHPPLRVFETLEESVPLDRSSEVAETRGTAAQ